MIPKLFVKIEDIHFDFTELYKEKIKKFFNLIKFLNVQFILNHFKIILVILL